MPPDGVFDRVSSGFKIVFFLLLIPMLVLYCVGVCCRFLVFAFTDGYDDAKDGGISSTPVPSGPSGTEQGHTGLTEKRQK